MNELTGIRRAYDVIDEPSQETTTAARRALLRAIEEADGRVQAVRPRRHHRRLVVVAAAAAIAVVTASAIAAVRDVFVGGAAHGRVSRTVEGVRFTLSVPGWANGPIEQIGGTARTYGLYISKSVVGPQDAEAVIYWTGFHDRAQATPCTKLLSSASGGSTAELAAAVATAPGTKVISGPSRVTVGGRPAQQVMLTVRRDLGCAPGYFFSWRFKMLGAFWEKTEVGDTIRVWIIDVHGTRLVIEAETHKNAGRDLEQEITKIIGSIRFD